MYLNILLKRKTGQTHNFPYNASTDIKTDKEHIHRGFKDHKGLSYSFSGSTTYSTDNRQLYQGHTKNYSPTKFNYNRNYDREYYSQFHIHPKTRPVELYTEYKNRYPNLNPNQYSIEMWQTEKGVPNELNRAIRHEKTGRSLEQIEADDNDYAQGLARLEETIKKRLWEIKQDKNISEEKFNEEETTSKRSRNAYKLVNPVVIKPALRKKETFIPDFKFNDKIRNVDNVIANTKKNIIAKREQKDAVKSVLDDVLNNVDRHIEAKEGKATKIQTLMRQKLAEKKLEEKRNTKRNSLDSVITDVGSTGVDESKNDDTKTVVLGATPLTESRRINEASAIEILDKYVKEDDEVKLESLNKEDFIKIKGMASVLGLPTNIKKLGAFRKYLKPTVKNNKT